jgi:NTE family protein
MSSSRTALVLGGGGITGIAWLLGVLTGLADANADITGADTVIGTSAGASVGAQITTTTTTGGLARAFAAQFEPSAESPVRPSPARLTRLVLALMRPGRPERKLARLGHLAMKAEPLVSPEQRLADIRATIGDAGWPERDLRVTAVEAETGAFTVFDRESGVDLAAAVAASRAVPLVAPPMVIGDRHYIDGGMRSPANADLATGADLVVVIAPRPNAASRDMAITAQLARTGAPRTLVITPDGDGQSAMGRNPYDVARRAGTARAGQRQGLAEAVALRELLG